MEMTQLDRELQEIALKDWQRFVAMIGEDAVTTAKVCLLRQSGSSYGQIRVAIKNMTIDKARWACKQCDS